jgi:hypothetical protein
LRLRKNTDYTLELGDGIHDDTGTPLVRFRQPFHTGNACDDAPLTPVGDPLVVVEGERVTVRIAFNKPSTVDIRLSAEPTVTSCKGDACEALWRQQGLHEVDAVPGTTVRFVHVFVLEPVKPESTYRYRVHAEDDSELAVDVDGTVNVPVSRDGRVRITEVQANPYDAHGSERTGEFIELHNESDVEVDLAGDTLVVDADLPAQRHVCALPATMTTRMPPHSYRVLVAAAFDGAQYGGVAEHDVIRFPTSTICGPLPNTRPQTLILQAPDGHVVTMWGAFAHRRPHLDGRSLERTAPDAPDVEASECSSRSDTGPTPAADNGIWHRGCDGGSD